MYAECSMSKYMYTHHRHTSHMMLYMQIYTSSSHTPSKVFITHVTRTIKNLLLPPPSPSGHVCSSSDRRQSAAVLKTLRYIRELLTKKRKWVGGRERRVGGEVQPRRNICRSFFFGKHDIRMSISVACEINHLCSIELS